MNPERRLVLNAGVALGAAALVGDAFAQPPADYMKTADPGKPGDFDFLQGNWKIRHKRLLKPGEWDDFEGEATCWSILGGVASIEELRIPARDFAGMGLRLLDVPAQVWRDHWVNAKSGVLTPPGMPGGFSDGAGTFIADDRDGDQPIKVRGIWDRITPASCRWHQAISRDGGASWQPNWFMDWTRA